MTNGIVFASIKKILFLPRYLLLLQYQERIQKNMKLFHLVLLMVLSSVIASATTLDSLMYEVENKKEKGMVQETILAYEALLKGLQGKEKFSEMITESENAILLIDTENDNNHYAQFLHYQGYGYERLGKYHEALERYDRILKLDKDRMPEKVWINTLCQTSSSYQALGNYEKAYDLQMKALHLYEASNDTVGMGRSNYIIGTIFYYQKQYNEALRQYEKALFICEETKIQFLIYSCLGALGSTHEKLGNISESILFNTKALQLAKDINYDSGIAYSLDNIGTGHLQNGNCEKAKESILESIKLKKRLKDNWGILGSKFSMVKVFEQCEEQGSVLPLLLEVLSMSKELGAKSRELEVYERLSEFYDKRDPITAYKYTKKFIALKDTVLNEKTLEEMGQSKQRYELVTKEHEINMLKAENKILNVSKENQRLYVILYLGSVILFLLAIFWFFSRLNMQRRVNEMLESKNDLLNLKNEEIRVKNKQLEHSNEDLAQFAYVASHDLKEPLRMIHSYTTLIERRYNDKLDESGKEFMHYIVDAVDRMKNLLDDLLDYSRSGKQEMPDTLISVADMMIVVEANLKGQIEDNKGSLIVRNENLPSILAHKSQLMQLLQNLVSNGMKFRGERDPIIIIDCVKKNDQFIFSVKDNGIGISKTNQEKVFEMFRRLHTREEYAGTGIGLATCKKIVSNMGGDIWVESEEGVGSTFFFAVPCPAETMEPA